MHVSLGGAGPEIHGDGIAGEDCVEAVEVENGSTTLSAGIALEAM